MSTIVLCLRKQRKNDCNKDDWWMNKYKRPFAFTSEVNKMVRDKSSDMDKFIAHILWSECYRSEYPFPFHHKRRGI